MNEVTCAEHYDALITEDNDPVFDPEPLQRYMDKWDGSKFMDLLSLSKQYSVLEIGVGTGRLARRVAPHCNRFVGIDLSCLTVERGRDNLSAFHNAELICGDFLSYRFSETFDVIYSSLTFLHIADKEAAIKKVFQLLNVNGKFVLSIDKAQDTTLQYENRFVKTYPDTPECIIGLLQNSGFLVEKQLETEFAYLFSAKKAQP